MIVINKKKNYMATHSNWKVPYQT